MSPTQLHDKCPKLGTFIDDSEIDVLTHMDFPTQHRTRIHSKNSLERLNKEMKRRADVVGIFPNEGSIAPPTMLQLFSGKLCCNVILCGLSMVRVFASAC